MLKKNDKFDCALTDRDKIDILMHAEEMQRKELNIRLQEENKIFPWVSAILVSINGALLFARFSASSNLRWLFPVEKIGAIVLIMILIGFALWWQEKHHELYLEGAKVLYRIEIKLHYFDENWFSDLGGSEALFPCRWKDWGYKGETWTKYSYILMGCYYFYNLVRLRRVHPKTRFSFAID